MKDSKNNAVVWFEIYVDDMDRAQKFYESILDIKLEKMDAPKMDGEEFEMVAFPGDMNNYGANGALVKMPGFPVGKNSVQIYFGCDDCATEEARVEEFGGKIEKSKQSIGEHGFISIISDTEGNMFGLHSMN